MDLFTTDKKYLFDELPEKMRQYRISYSDIPVYITDNLRFELFDWQKKALFNFLRNEGIGFFREAIYQ